jgi:hypothetical protein
MKTVIIALIALGLCTPAWSVSISTTDGVTYNNVTTQRVDPDGLYIEYTMPNGGLGMSKIKFSRLSADQQKQFGYDATKARDYELGVAKAAEDNRQESIRMEQIAQAARHTRDAENERASTSRFIAVSQANAVQSATSDAGGYYTWYGGGIGLYALPRLGPAPPAKRVYAPVVTPIPFPRVNSPTRSSR